MLWVTSVLRVSALLLLACVQLHSTAVSPMQYPDISDTASAFKINIQRSYTSPFELSLIIKSEEAAPTLKFYERMRARDAKKKKRRS
ncbi:MAG: hypothetical protein V1913_11310, partial [Fibrobacterota bacterium]